MSKAQPGPEHQAKHKISEWLGSHGADVWWEEANKWGHKKFKIVDRAKTGGIPDMLVQINGYTFVIEFKVGDSAGNVYDSLIQLHGYWVEQVTTDQTYEIDGRAVQPDGFLTATKYSRFGRLFHPNIDKTPDRLADFDESRATCCEYGQLPPAEFRMTEQHVRIMWRLGKQSLDGLDQSLESPFLGSMLSEHLEQECINPRPAVLWNRGTANQSWEVLGQ